MHGPDKIMLDLAISIAIGGDCASDLSVFRCEPAVFGSVASDRAVSRLIATLAGDASKALKAMPPHGPEHVRWHRNWLAPDAPDHSIDEAYPLVIDC